MAAPQRGICGFAVVTTAVVPPEVDGAAAPGSPLRRFDGFDGLRAIAAFAVLFHHVSLQSNQMTFGHFNHQFTQLDTGVAIFFLISGYLLYRPFVDRQLRDRPEPPVGPFLLRRAARIFPAYWLALGSIILIGHFTHGQWLGLQHPIAGGVWAYVRYFGLVHIYRTFGEASGALSQAWTLAVEITFYVFLPCFAAMLRRIGRRASLQVRVGQQLTVLALMYLASTAFRVWCFYGHIGRLRAIGQYWLPANLDLFALGMALAVVSVAIETEIWSPRIIALVRRWPSLFWTAGIVLFYVGATRINVGLDPGPTQLQSMERHVGQGIVALFLLLPIVFRGSPRSLVMRLVDWKPLAYCGVVSYGIYLWHQSWIAQAVHLQYRPVFHASLPLLVSFGATMSVLTATLSWYGVERPIVQWASRRARGRARA